MNLICQRASQQIVIVLDTSESFHKLIEILDLNVKVIDVCNDGIGIKPFNPIDFKSSHTEKGADTAMRFCDTLKNIYQLGVTQNAYLYKAVKQSMGYEVDNNSKLKEIYCGLVDQKGDSVAKLCAKLEYIVDSEIFADREDFDVEVFNGCGVILIRMSHLSTEIKRLITEFSLWEIWKVFQENQDKRHRVTIVLDECQTLDFSHSSPITKMLTEGRKFGISCWLATQFLKGQFNDQTINRLDQAGVKLYFKQTEGDATNIAKKIEYSRKKAWTEILKGLKIGEFVALAPLRVNNHLQKNAIIVKAEFKG